MVSHFRALGFLGLVSVVTISCSSSERSDQAPAPRDEGSVVVDGAELGWVREGEGPPLFVIGSTIYYPRAYSERLRQHFQLIFVDGRHFTPDNSPPERELDQVTLATFADDIEAIREALGFDSISVVGHSIHGQIALEYADRYAQSTARVVLIGAVPFAMDQFAAEVNSVWERLASGHRKEVLASRLDDLDSLLAASPAERSFAVTYRQNGPLYWANPDYDAGPLLEDLENGPAFSRLVSTLPDSAAARVRLERIEVPILLILGRLDFAVPYTAWENLIAGVERVDYVLLEEDSHNPQTESPARFDSTLIEWFERRP